VTPKERILKAVCNEQPDHVPASPDMWEMIPVRLMDKPSWEFLVYEDPPQWKGRMDACTHFGVDAFFGLFVPMAPRQIPIVYKSDEKLITRTFTEHEGKRQWSPFATVFTPYEPSAFVKADAIGLPAEHEDFEIVKTNYSKFGREYFEDARAYVGDEGVVAPMVCLPCLGLWEDEILRFYDDHDAALTEKRNQGEEPAQAAHPATPRLGKEEYGEDDHKEHRSA